MVGSPLRRHGQDQAAGRRARPRARLRPRIPAGARAERGRRSTPGPCPCGSGKKTRSVKAREDADGAPPDCRRSCRLHGGDAVPVLVLRWAPRAPVDHDPAEKKSRLAARGGRLQTAGSARHISGAPVAVVTPRPEGPMHSGSRGSIGDVIEEGDAPRAARAATQQVAKNVLWPEELPAQRLEAWFTIMLEASGPGAGNLEVYLTWPSSARSVRSGAASERIRQARVRAGRRGRPAGRSAAESAAPARRGSQLVPARARRLDRASRRGAFLPLEPLNGVRAAQAGGFMSSGATSRTWVAKYHSCPSGSTAP